ncbi:MAG: hypothetical protein HYU41_20325 [Candidatus Rokubacteria bacterium]|nr:hypothetical protein [Candidatus Rokubacteria bacterium]
MRRVAGRADADARRDTETGNGTAAAARATAAARRAVETRATSQVTGANARHCLEPETLTARIAGWYAWIVADPDRHDVTLNALHQDLTSLGADMTGMRGEMRAGFGDLKTTLIAGFRGLPNRESSEEMIRLLREANRLHEERFTQIDLRLREQHLEVQQVLRALAEGQLEVQRVLRAVAEGQIEVQQALRDLAEEQRQLSAEIRALVARLDALIKGRGNGNPPP